MKKIISILLIVSMTIAMFAVVFAGSITAVAADNKAVVAEYQTTDEELTNEEFAAIVTWILSLLRDIDKKVGIFSVLVDGIINIIKTYFFDVDVIYSYLQNSGIVEWVAHLVFPS